MIVARENESESLREARLADYVERMIDAIKNYPLVLNYPLFSNYYLAIFSQSCPIAGFF